MTEFEKYIVGDLSRIADALESISRALRSSDLPGSVTDDEVSVVTVLGELALAVVRMQERQP